MPRGPKKKKSSENLPTYAKNIEVLRGKKTMAEFAKLLGVSPMAVSHWESGTFEPGVQHYLAMAQLASGDAAKFFTASAHARSGLPVAASVDSNAAPSKSSTSVPLLSVVAAAGSGYFQETEDIEGSISLPSDMLPHPERTRCIRVIGDSMVPTIPIRSIAAVDGSERRPDKLLGKVVVAEHLVEGSVIKRLGGNGTDYWLHSDNQAYPDIPLQPGSGWEIVGRVIWWIHTE